MNDIPEREPDVMLGYRVRSKNSPPPSSDVGGIEYKGLGAGPIGLIEAVVYLAIYSAFIAGLVFVMVCP